MIKDLSEKTSELQSLIREIEVEMQKQYAFRAKNTDKRREEL